MENRKETIYDNPPCRRNTDCVKYDTLEERYGRSDLISMWVADMDFPVPEAVRDALRARVEHPVYGYPSVPESYWESVISWIKDHYGFTPERAELSYIPGIVRGIGFALNFYTRPGDKVLIMPPVYHPFRNLTEGNGRVCVTCPLETDASGRFQIDFRKLREKVADERPVMMILCNPHNPGGRQWTLDELSRVAEIADEYDVKVISDEIHGDLMLDGNIHHCYFEAGPSAIRTGIVFGAPSKTFNIPGLVSSWIAIRNPELREDFYNWLEVNEFNAPTFFATIATEAAYTKGSGWLADTIGYIRENMRCLQEALAGIPGIRMIMPDASYLVWLDCRGLHLSQDDLNRLFCEKAGLALNDGTTFGAEGEGFMRMNVGLPRKELQLALEKLKQAVRNEL